MRSTNGPRLPMPILLYAGRHAHQCGIDQAITLAECTLLCTILALSISLWHLCILMWLVQMAMDLVLLCVDRYMHMHMHLPLLMYMCLHTRMYIHIYIYNGHPALWPSCLCVAVNLYNGRVDACLLFYMYTHAYMHTYIHTYIGNSMKGYGRPCL